MTYMITGLDPAPFAGLADLDDDQLAARNVRRVVATAKPGYPCRVTLEDAEPGETLFLLSHVSHDVATPYRSLYAIYVRAGATARAHMDDAIPPVFEGRPIALRGFGADGMLQDARLALPGQSDAGIRALFDMPIIAYIDAHNAAHGCFAARVERAG